MLEQSPLSERQVVEAIREVVGKKLEPDQVVSADTPLLSLPMDSLDRAELFMALEERCGVSLDPESAKAATTVGDLVNLQRSSR